MKSYNSVIAEAFPMHHVSRLSTADLPTVPTKRLPHNPISGSIILLRHSITTVEVQEYQPVIHRLRLSASP